MTMAISFVELMASGGAGATAEVTITVNQDDRVATYATGTVSFRPGGVRVRDTLNSRGPIFIAPSIATEKGGPLKAYFSNRRLDIDPPSPNPFGNDARQPFSANAVDEWGFSVSQNFASSIVGRVKLLSWGGASLSVPFEPRGNLLVGTGPGGAVYVVSFSQWTIPPG
jgi:hypothetical protein